MWSLAQSNCTTPTGTSYPRRPGPCSVAAVHPRKSPSATEPTQRSASKPRHKRYLTQLKPQIPALRRYLQEPSGCPPQRWTLLNLTESLPASILPTLKRQKSQVRRNNSPAGRRYGLALRLNTKGPCEDLHDCNRAAYDAANATIMATIASVREIPSTQRTTPVVRPCRTSVAVFMVGRPSDIAAPPLLR